MKTCPEIGEVNRVWPFYIQVRGSNPLRRAKISRSHLGSGYFVLGWNSKIMAWTARSSSAVLSSSFLLMVCTSVIIIGRGAPAVCERLPSRLPLPDLAPTLFLPCRPCFERLPCSLWLQHNISVQIYQSAKQPNISTQICVHCIFTQIDNWGIL